MLALTIWQPHATLLAIGARRIETRGWSTAYRGPLVIHAAARWDADRARECGDAGRMLAERDWTIESLAGRQAFARLPWRETLGRVLAIADLVDCRPIPEPQGTWLDRSLGGFGRGRFGWFLENPRLVQPAYRGGRQGLWDCSVTDLVPFTGGDAHAPSLFSPES